MNLNRRDTKKGARGARGDKPSLFWRMGKSLLDFIRGLIERRWTMVFGVAFILGGELLVDRGRAADSYGFQLAGRLITELGTAFVVAAVLFVLIEEWSARHHAKTAIGLLYGIRPEGWFFRKIEEYVLRQKFYRTAVKVTYAFKEEKDENILIHQSISYTLINRCAEDEQAQVPISARIDIKTLHVGETVWDEDLGLKRLAINGQDIEVEKDVCLTTDPERRKQSWKFQVPDPLAYNGSMDVAAVHHVVKHNHDAAVWTSVIPCDGVELCVTWDEPLRLRFMFSATHPELGDLEAETGERIRTVRCPDTAFLKGHGIHFWWAPENELPAVPTPDASEGASQPTATTQTQRQV